MQYVSIELKLRVGMGKLVDVAIADIVAAGMRYRVILKRISDRYFGVWIDYWGFRKLSHRSQLRYTQVSIAS